MINLPTRQLLKSLLKTKNKTGKVLPKDILNNLLTDVIFKGLLYEKTARMYIGWLTSEPSKLD